MKLMQNQSRIRLSMTAFLVLTILGISSCKKDDSSIGIGTLPDGEGLNISVDTIIPTVQLYPSDSILTDELAESFIGNYSDPVFGSSQTEFFAQLELEGNNLNIGEPADLVLDSAVLVMIPTGYTVGNIVDQEINVYRLSQDIYNDSIYYSNQTTSFDDSEDLVLDGFTMTKFGSDEDLIEEIRIPMDLTLGQSLIDQSGTDVFSDNDSFQEFFPGIAITSNTANGAIIGIDPNNSLTGLHLYYRDNSDTEEDTLSVIFPIDNGSAYFNSINRDYTSSPIDDIINGGEANNRVFLQGGQGIMAKLDISDFPDSLIGNNSVSVAKAQLILPISKTQNTGYQVPPVIFISTGNVKDSLNILEDEITVFSIGGIYDSELESYVFDISYHIQSVISEQIDVKPLWISINPAERLRTFMDNLSTYSNKIVNQRRVVLNGPNFNSVNLEENMRLILTYSE